MTSAISPPSVAPALQADAARTRGIRRVLWATLCFNLAVAAGKVITGVWVGSLAVRADGFHSSTDALNNIVLLVGIWLGSRPPDPEHPYGHKKLEVVAATIVGAGLLLVAVDLVRELVARLRGDVPPPHITGVVFVVLAVTLVVNIIVAVWEARAAKVYQSPALASDAAHTRSDVVVTLGVMASAGLSAAGYPWLDGVAGAAVACVITVAGVRIVRENAGYLIDTSLIDREALSGAALEVEGVRAVRVVRSRGSPSGIWLDLTIAVDGASTVDQGHTLAHSVEDRLRQRFTGVVGVQIHVEPA